MNEKQVQRLKRAWGVEHVKTVTTGKGKIHLFDGYCEGDPEYPTPSYRTLWILENDKDRSGRPLYFDPWDRSKKIIVPSDRETRVQAALQDALSHLEADAHA